MGTGSLQTLLHMLSQGEFLPNFVT